MKNGFHAFCVTANEGSGAFGLPTPTPTATVADLNNATYVPNTWDGRVGAFDAIQLAIRPDQKHDDHGRWRNTYPEEGFPAQEGENFHESLFPFQSDARLLFDVGINPGDVGQWVINADLSRNYIFPEWDPADISFAGLTP